ncbi:hypothetical protein IMZ48_15975, partial [Candidatus Bathyarchaeota archaeon]|nr:hypothetical protein [Candidatus Bathyarchaeota archaeon]
MSVSFSYAQAAKGKAAAAAAAAASGSTSPSTAAASVTGAPDHQIKDVLLNGAPEPAAPAADARNDEPEPMRNSKAEAIPAASVSDASCTTNNDTPGTSGPPSNDSRRDDDTNSERSARRTANDTKSQAPGPRAPRPASTTADSKRPPRKERKTKGAGNGPKNADKESDAAETVKEAAPPPPKVELFDSPIPAKNPWQRLGTQTATTKQGASEPASPNTAAPSARKSAAASSSSTVKPGSDAVAVNGLGIQRKGGEGDTSGKNGVHKNGARRAAEQLPSDTAHWPTPDTANKDQKPRPSDKTVEPQESPSQDGQKGSKTKGWVKMEFVPSVSFKTQIPPKGGRPRGGARGGRDGTTRGGHAASSAKDGEKGSGPPAGSSKVNGDAPEGARDAPANARGSSVPPTTTKRGSADAPGVRDQRKQSVLAAAKSKDSATNVSSPHDKDPRR